MKTKLTIFVVNFNTTQMTELCIMKIQKYCQNYDYQIILLDNSNKIPYGGAIINNMVIVDNTKNQVIDYDFFVKKYCRCNFEVDQSTPKHAYAIQWMIDNCKTDDLLIIDSDAFMVSEPDFIDNKFITIAGIGNDFKKNDTTRFYPFIQYFNIMMIKQNNIRYFDENRIRFGLNPQYNGWDTGCSFYNDILNNKIPYKIIDYKKYVNHLSGGSWHQLYYGASFTELKIKSFIEKNR